MSSPKRVMRIVWKNARLETRPGRGQRKGKRSRLQQDLGPPPLASGRHCKPNLAFLTQARAQREALAVAKDLRAYRCKLCNLWHYGHPLKGSK